MRERIRNIVYTFLSTEQAMAVESLAKKEGFPGRMIPVPPEIKNGCGLCWCCYPQERKIVEDALHSFSLPFGAVHEIMRYETKYSGKPRHL